MGLLVLLALAAGLAFGAVPSKAQTPQPSVGASIDFDWVSLSGWPSGSTVSLNIGGTVLNATVDPGGNAFVQRQTHGRDIIAGLAITASQGPTTKTLTVANLRVVSVDVAADTVSGVGPPSAAVRVSINQPPGGQLGQADTTADFQGNWFVSFAGGVDLRLGAGMSVNATTPDEDSDYTAADRNLVQPAINALLTFDSIMANAFTPGGSVTFTIRSSGGAVLATGTKPTDGGGNASFNRFQDHTVDLVPAMSVTATDGLTTKGLTLAPLAIASIDPGTDVVAGTAPADAHVQVTVSVPPSGAGAGLQVTAGAEGSWSADFTGTFDITPGTGANASVTDFDGDSTGVNKPPATINASLTFDNVNAMGFAANGNVTFTIRQSPGGTILATGTKPTEPNGNTTFNRHQDHTVDLAPGMHISAGDGTVTKGLTLDPLAILSIDPATDVVSGTAPADAKVNVNVNKPGGGGSSKQVTADAGGAWSADFSPFDVTAGIGANASVQDQDLDSTGYDKAPSTITASLPYDMIGANGFAPGGSVTFKIFQSPGGAELASGTRPADSGGNASFDRFMGDHDVDLIPGMHITAADALTTKELTLAALTITSIDPATDVVSGTAPATAAVNVGVYESPGGGPGPGLQVTAGPGGAWSADFTGAYDVLGTTGARAFVGDADGDQTGTDKQSAIVSASLGFDNIDASRFEPGGTVTFTIRATPGGAILATATRPTDGQGNAMLGREGHSVDLVPGMEITVSDGTSTKQVTLVPLAIVSVVPAADTVSGTAEPGARVDLHVNDPSGGQDAKEVIADAQGGWSADFTGAFDVTWTAWANASVADADGDSTTFSRRPATISVMLSGDGVEASWFAPSANATLTIRSSGGTVLGTATKQADAVGNVWFDRWGGDFHIDLAPGMQVAVTDGTTTKELTAAALSIASVDPASDVVSGTAPPGAEVDVNLGWPWLLVTADAEGNWSADFTSQFDITYSTWADARVADGDGDTTGFAKPPAHLEASITGDNVNLNGFAPDADVTLTIRESPGGSVLATGTKRTDSAGDVSFERWAGDYDVDLAAGMEVTASDGTNTKELVLAALVIRSVDPASDVVSGTAPPGAEVWVDIGDETGGTSQPVTADPDGDWSVDFSPFDVTYTMRAQAYVDDAETDTTFFEMPPARVDVSLTWDTISVEGFAPGATLSFTIRQSPGGTVLASGGGPADGAGNAWFERYAAFDVDLAPGLHVTVTDGTTTKQLTVAGVAIGSVNTATDVVAGTAPAGALVEVELGGDSGGAYRTTTADGLGNWSIDFSPFDITFATWADARVRDADGDASACSKPPARIEASVTWDGVSVEGFAANGSVTFTIRQTPGGAILASGTRPADGAGSAWFSRPDEHDVDLAAGMHVTATDGTTTKELTLTTVGVARVDPGADVVTGTAAAGSAVEVEVENELAWSNRPATTDPSGHWSVDFSPFDITYDTWAQARAFDGDGDSTVVGKSPPRIGASLTFDDVSVDGLASEATATFTIRQAPGGAVLASGTRTTNAGGYAEYRSEDHLLDLAPGMQITVTDGLVTKTLVLHALSITTVDPATDLISGRAPVGAQVHVSVGDGSSGDYRPTTADGSGNWSVDFSPFDVTATMRADANVADADGDGTSCAWVADLRFSAAAYSAGEGAGTVQITVQRAGGAPAEVGVSFATADGSATAGADYTATSGTLTFPAGAASRTFTVPILEDGSDEPNETVLVTLSDPSGGGVLTAPSTATITITDNDETDTTPPETNIDSGPSGLTSDATPTFAFSSEPGATFQCRLDAAAFALCTSPYTTVALADGDHTFQVRATDTAGNPDASPANRTFTVHTGVPATTILSGPPPLSNDATPTFRFSADEEATFECRVDAAAFAVCLSPYTTVALADGSHSFEVRAVDLAGNADATPAGSGPFTVHTGIPVTTIVSGPSGPTTDSTPTFTFTADEPATFECRLDGAAFAACSSPYTTGALGLGSHTFEVRGTDAAGNVDGTPEARAFTVTRQLATTSVSVTARVVKVTRTRIAAVKLRCGTARCTGTVALYRGKLKLGSRAFSIPARSTATINVRLTARGYKLLVAAKRLQTKARISYRQPSGATTTVTRTITLVAPKRAPR